MEENRAENQTPRRQHTQHPTHQAHKKKKSGTAKTVIGTILAIGLTTCLMFFAIFMVYVHTSLDLNVDISAYTLKQSSTVYYQDKTSGEWVELTKLHRRREPHAREYRRDPQACAGGADLHRGRAL